MKAAPAVSNAVQAGPAISVDRLRMTLATTHEPIVYDVKFEVSPGEIFGLVGESGSGKTTVALMLCGYARRGLVVEEGRVVVAGTDMRTASPANLRQLRGATVAYVPQDPASALNPALSIELQIREVLRAHGANRPETQARIQEVLEEVKLPAELLGRYPHQLSGGQQQRAAIAMAFACRPRVIVMDEPTTGLDVTTQRIILDTLSSLCHSYGVAGVFVSHDLAVVAGLTDQVAVMYAGTICEIGPSDEVFGSPAHRYTRALIRAIPSPDRPELLETIPGRQGTLARAASGCAFAPRCDSADDACRSTSPRFVPISSDRHRARCLHPNVGHVTRTTMSISARSSAVDREPSVLTVRDLSASYGSVQVLDGVGFSVAPGTCVALVGESGSGKTTLARCLAGLHTGWSGELTFEESPLDVNIRHRSKTSLQRLQHVFQNPYTSLNPRKTIRQILTQPLARFFDQVPNLESRIRQALADMALGSHMVDLYPHQLSGGERQRVAIARALIVEPSLVVCDEITSALDVSVQATIIELLRQLQVERGLALLFITHNLALVRSIAQTTVVMASGRVVECGPTERVLSDPQHPYTRHLLRDIPRLSPPPTVAAAL